MSLELYQAYVTKPIPPTRAARTATSDVDADVELDVDTDAVVLKGTNKRNQVFTCHGPFSSARPPSKPALPPFEVVCSSGQVVTLQSLEQSSFLLARTQAWLVKLWSRPHTPRNPPGATR